VTIDYLAKDFSSFTQALSELSTARYPAWLERSEADLGVMLMEALAAIADELSYYQDRVSAESSIVTATQRLSVLRHARLVDYEPAPATVATTLVQLEVTGGPITAPLHCLALAADGTPVDFEIGDGLADPVSGAATPISFDVDPRWNRYLYGANPPGTLNLAPYWWDESQQCLQAGSSVLYVVGHGHAFYGGQQLLLDTAPPDSADPPVRELVTLSDETGFLPLETEDPVLGVELTQLFLASPTALEHDLSLTAVAGNLVPVVQGLRNTDWFYVPGGPGGVPLAPQGVSPLAAIVRTGANSTPEDPVPSYRYCLSSGPLAWIAAASSDADTPVPAIPEIVLADQSDAAQPAPWPYVRWLLDAGAANACFTLTPEQYSPVLTSSGVSSGGPAGGAVTYYDYDGDGGTTIRFGEGVFGQSPVPGSLFSVLYRVGGGTLGNVPADTIVSIAPGQAESGLVIACTNPFAASGGSDAETLAQVAERAPQQFAAEPLRVVQAGDYVAAAQSLAFVQQAGTSFRWTGSWLSVFTTADPVGAEQPSIDQLQQLTTLLDGRRLAGYESYVLPPRYVSVDLALTICADPAYFVADVESAVLARLRPGALPGGGYGFFDHSQWSFGQPLESSALFAAVQSCTGVAGIYDAQYRQRGVQPGWTELPETVSFASDQILRVDDDPSRPEAGSLTITVAGGK
jgi:hypothetical protein